MTSQSDQTVAILQDLIERGELLPGAMLSERRLMDLTGFGRTPVREAVQRLALSHMLRIHPGRGVEIPPVSVEDQLSRLEVRRSLEVLAVTLACERASARDIAEMRGLVAQPEPEPQPAPSLLSYSDEVRLTHGIIIRAAHNPYLEALMKPLQTLSRRFWIMNVRDEAQEIATGRALHRQVLTTIAARDFKQARDASLALNDYLVRFALNVLAQRARIPA